MPMIEAPQLDELPHIPDSERLIPVEGYVIDRAAEIEVGAKTPYPFYPTPEERIHMTLEQIAAWQEAGGKTSDLPVGAAAVNHHPNYQAGLAKGRATPDTGTQDFHATTFDASFDQGGYTRDERGLPVRPEDAVFLQAGAVEGIGFYWNYGPNKAADPVVFRQPKGKLQVLVIRRNDTGLTALPGGMEDPNEPGVSTALRELLEEAGLDLSDVPHEIVHTGIVWGDPRATRHAWPESTVALLLPESDRTDNVHLKAGDDAREALWLDVSTENVERLFASHPAFVKLAVQKWQDLTGNVVAKSGMVGLAA